MWLNMNRSYIKPFKNTSLKLRKTVKKILFILILLIFLTKKLKIYKNMLILQIVKTGKLKTE